MKTKNRGFTLVEVVIAMLLTAIIVTGVFSLALTIRAGNVHTDRKLIADQYARQLSSVLKSYVTADCSASTVSMAPKTAAGGHSWSLTGVASPGGVISDSCGGCYALAPGHHVLTNFLPSTAGAGLPLAESSPYNGRICYDVNYSGACTPDATCTNTAAGAPSCQSATAAGPPSVCIDVYWNEPTP
ncbi:MAG TPA: prepilin-type N-terminal cleavage/methylation domain-containing protein [Elusimicrobiota bacterium]|nr:prepilin-type N-terminal cleavage/methylation domain-containing protein [Elusimicrobiota bacterium]